MDTQGFEWRSQRMYPMQKLKEPNEPQYHSESEQYDALRRRPSSVLQAGL